MKLSLIIFLVFLLGFQPTQSQVLNTSTDKLPQKSYDYFSLKQKRQKTAAWICLGGGVAITIVGTALAINNLDEALTSAFSGENSTKSRGFESGGVLMILGGSATLASIPLFISAGKNRKKAALSIKGEPSAFRNRSYRGSQHLSIALTVKF